MEHTMENAATLTQATPRTLTKWIKALRLYSLTASLIPVLVGVVLAVGHAGARWELFPLIAASVLLLHIGTNLANDYYDYESGLDREGALGGSGVLVSGALSARQVGRAAAVSFAGAALLGLPLVWARGWPLAALGVAGLLGGILYTAKPVQYKYWGAGDVLVFLLMGPLMVVGTHYALTGTWQLSPLLASVPVGLLVAAILHANNLRDMDMDAEFELKTLAIRLGRRRSVQYLDALVGGAYAAVALGVYNGLLLWPTLAVALSAPLAGALLKGARNPAGVRTAADLAKQAAALHFLFGLLLALGLAAGAWLG